MSHNVVTATNAPTPVPTTHTDVDPVYKTLSDVNEKPRIQIKYLPSSPTCFPQFHYSIDYCPFNGVDTLSCLHSLL